MLSTLQRLLHGALIFGLVGTGLSYAMLTQLTWSQAGQGRSTALQRWSERTFANYRISLRMEYRGEYCFQQLEVQEGQLPQALRNTCDPAWLDLLTVPQLFDLSRQIEDIPTSRCYPSTRWCICQRVFSNRQIYYDDALGYPALLLTRSDLEPNWTSADFWQRLTQTNTLPNCGPAPRRLTVQVLALTPIP